MTRDHGHARVARRLHAVLLEGLVQLRGQEIEVPCFVVGEEDLWWR